MTSEHPWWRYDPARLQSDTAVIEREFPDLAPVDGGAGLGWEGVLPLWPFARPAPAQFRSGVAGLGLKLVFLESYPMSMPQVFPLGPEPEFLERTQHRWHVNGDGSLCLVQEQRAWTGRESIRDLLLKAAGWRLEYDLVRVGVYPSMSENGIVTDDRRDEAIAAYFGAS